MPRRITIAALTAAASIALLAGCTAAPTADPTTEPGSTTAGLDKAPTLRSESAGNLSTESTNARVPAEVEDQIPDGYEFAYDDLDLLAVVVPEEWDDRFGEPAEGDNGRTWAQLVVSPDLEGYVSGWETPGLELSGTDTGQELESDVLADFLGQLSTPFEGACEANADAIDYDDGLYVGLASTWTDCDGGDAIGFAIVAQDPEFNHFVWLRGILVSEEDQTDTWDLILTTFQSSIGADSFDEQGEERAPSRLNAGN